MNSWFLCFLTLTTFSSSWNQYGLRGADISVDCSLNKLQVNHTCTYKWAHTHMYRHMHKHTPQHTWRSENNTEVSASLHQAGLRDGAQVFKLGIKHPYFLHHFPGPYFFSDIEWCLKKRYMRFLHVLFLPSDFLHNYGFTFQPPVKTWSRALRWLKGHVTTKHDSLKKALLTTLPISFLLHLTGYRHLSICLTNVIIWLGTSICYQRGEENRDSR